MNYLPRLLQTSRNLCKRGEDFIFKLPSSYDLQVSAVLSAIQERVHQAHRSPKITKT